MDLVYVNDFLTNDTFEQHLWNQRVGVLPFKPLAAHLNESATLVVVVTRVRSHRVITLSCEEKAAELKTSIRNEATASSDGTGPCPPASAPTLNRKSTVFRFRYDWCLFRYVFKPND